MPGGQQRGVHEHTLHGGGPGGPQGSTLRVALLLQVAGGAKEELETGQVQPGGQWRALHEHTLHGDGQGGPQGPQHRAALLLQVSGGAKEAGQLRPEDSGEL